MAVNNRVNGVHLCGSLKAPFENDETTDELVKAKEVMRATALALPSRIRRLPDGELGKRDTFVLWQTAVFGQTPGICVEAFMPPSDTAVPSISSDAPIKLGALGYSKFAIQNFAAFTELKQEGIIDADTKYLVCLPTPINPVTFFVRREFRDRVEPMYEKMLLDELKEIQDSIPHNELAIQWDCPGEIAILEGASGPYDMLTPHFEPSMEAVLGRLQRMMAAVEPDVEMGIHLCYGDLYHQHFKEPENTQILVDFANAIVPVAGHKIAWFHLPVPISRTDDGYFEALRQLKLDPTTELYLGLVHPHDLSGTEKRIATAQKYVPTFGVSTECGYGRTPRPDVVSILDIQKTVTTPI